MKRDEAIATLEAIKQFGMGKWIFDKEEIEAFDMAIESLSAEPTDLVSRAAVHKTLSLLATEGGTDAKMLLADAHEFIDAIPSTKVPTKCVAEIKIDADEVAQRIKDEYEIADRPSGEWSFIGDNLYECTCCGVAYTPDQLKATTIKKGQFTPNYCPNCGAKMGGNK